MPLSYLKRPLFLALAAYMLALAWLHARGFFDVWVPSAQLAWRGTPDLRVEGLVVSPRREDLRGVKFILGEARVGAKGALCRVQVFLPRGAADLAGIRPGRRLALVGALRLPRPARNPGDFDERSFLSDRGVGWVMRARAAEVVGDDPSWRWRLCRRAEDVRLWMEARFARSFDPVDAALLTGLTMGYKRPLPRDLNRAIQDAGAMHLLVPSGAKVAFVLLLASWLGARLPVRSRFLLCAAVGGFYTVMVGAEPPYARAFLGALALGLGAWLDRESGAFQAAVLSAWLILLSDPRALFSAGFQMTYLALSGLLLAMPRIDAGLPARWPRPARSAVCVGAATIIVQLALWPVFAQTFGRAALLGACANVALVPYSGVLLTAGLLFCAWPTALCAKALAAGLALFRWVCFHAASVPWAAVELSPIAGWAVLAYYLLVASVLVLPRRKAAVVLGCAGLAIGLGAAAWARATKPATRVIYLSLPEPAAIVLAGETATVVGPGAPAGAVRRALKALGVSRVDAMIPAAEARPVCEGRVCFSFIPPAVRSPEGEFSIIERLKKSSVEAATDGFRIELKDAQGRELHQFRGSLL